jgi:hypothetical protein
MTAYLTKIPFIIYNTLQAMSLRRNMKRPTLREPTKYFNANVTNEIQKEIRDQIIVDYSTSYNNVISGFSYEVSHDHYPQERLSTIEDNLKKLRRFPGVNVESRLNRKHTSYHTLVQVKNVVVTVSKVASRKKLPRNTLFRENLAGAQSYFVPKAKGGIQIRKPIYPSNSKLYAIIIHGTARGARKDMPSFIDVVIPDRSYKTIIDRLDLLTKDFSKIEKVPTVGKAELIKDQITPKLKSKVTTNSVAVQGKLL